MLLCRRRKWLWHCKSHLTSSWVFDASWKGHSAPLLGITEETAKGNKEQLLYKHLSRDKTHKIKVLICYSSKNQWGFGCSIVLVTLLTICNFFLVHNNENSTKKSQKNSRPECTFVIRLYHVHFINHSNFLSSTKYSYSHMQWPYSSTYHLKLLTVLKGTNGIDWRFSSVLNLRTKLEATIWIK